MANREPRLLSLILLPAIISNLMTLFRLALELSGYPSTNSPREITWWTSLWLLIPLAGIYFAFLLRDAPLWTIAADSLRLCSQRACSDRDYLRAFGRARVAHALFILRSGCARLSVRRSPSAIGLLADYNGHRRFACRRADAPVAEVRKKRASRVRVGAFLSLRERANTYPVGFRFAFDEIL